MTRYYYDGQNTVLEVDADEAPRRAYVHGAQYVDERVLVRLPTGKEYYYLPRELYSVAALTDETGEIVEAATYDTYGKVAVYDDAAQAVEESPVGNPYYFTGRRVDLLPLACGLKQTYHYRARQYGPRNGRFWQRDPLGVASAVNLYEYAAANPQRFGDPTGLYPLGGFPSENPPTTTPPPDRIGPVLARIQTCKDAISEVITDLVNNLGLSEGDWERFPNKSDKYYHCYHSCHLAAGCGSYASLFLGAMREAVQRLIAQLGGDAEAAEDALDDMMSNIDGINCARTVCRPQDAWQDCRKCCDSID